MAVHASLFRAEDAACGGLLAEPAPALQDAGGAAEDAVALYLQLERQHANRHGLEREVQRQRRDDRGDGVGLLQRHGMRQQRVQPREAKPGCSTLGTDPTKQTGIVAWQPFASYDCFARADLAVLQSQCCCFFGHLEPMSRTKFMLVLHAQQLLLC